MGYLRGDNSNLHHCTFLRHKKKDKMPRRGRAASPSRPVARAPSPPPRAPPPRAAAPPPAQVPAHAPQSQPMMAQPQQPSMMKQMAMTAGSVAVGSAVGHVAGHAMTGMFSGGSQPAAAEAAPAQQQQYAPPQQHQDQDGPCAWEMKQFIQCTQNQGDITLCEGFNQALKECKNRGAMYA